MAAAHHNTGRPNGAEITAEQLSRHVNHLVGMIGERNGFHPRALWAAEDDIQQGRGNQGYEVIPQDYTARGVRSAHLEITRRPQQDLPPPAALHL